MLKKKCKIILLSYTGKINYKQQTIWSNVNGQLLHTHSSPPASNKLNPLAIYIISDDKIIEEGSYCIDDTGLFGPYEKGDILINPRLVIATTDTSLSLPQPSEGFIRKYIESYNDPDRATISDVMVEYNKIEVITSGETYLFINGNIVDTSNNEEVNRIELNYKNKPKVDSNNCITITKVKDSFTLEEVKLHCREAIIYGIINAKNITEESTLIDEWFEKQNF